MNFKVLQQLKNLTRFWRCVELLYVSCLDSLERLSFISPVGWGCRIHRLHFCRRIRLPSKCPGYDTKQSDDEDPVILELWGMWSIPSLPLLPGLLWQVSIYGTNRAVQHLNCRLWQEQTNDLCKTELLEIEQFNHFNCVKTNDCLIELLVLNSNTWKH